MILSPSSMLNHLKKKKNLTCTLDCTGPEDGSVYQRLFACGL